MRFVAAAIIFLVSCGDYTLREQYCDRHYNCLAKTGFDVPPQWYLTCYDDMKNVPQGPELEGCVECLYSGSCELLHLCQTACGEAVKAAHR